MQNNTTPFNTPADSADSQSKLNRAISIGLGIFGTALFALVTGGVAIGLTWLRRRLGGVHERFLLERNNAICERLDAIDGGNTAQNHFSRSGKMVESNDSLNNLTEDLAEVNSNLAVASAEANNITLLIDTDTRQKTALEWFQKRENQDNPLVIEASDQKTLLKILELTKRKKIDRGFYRYSRCRYTSC